MIPWFELWSRTEQMPHKERARSSAISTLAKPFRTQTAAFLMLHHVDHVDHVAPLWSLFIPELWPAAVHQVVSIVKSTLGPRGMDKLIEEGSGTTITNDGATVMKKLNIATVLANSFEMFWGMSHDMTSSWHHHEIIMKSWTPYGTPYGTPMGPHMSPYMNPFLSMAPRSIQLPGSWLTSARPRTTKLGTAPPAS